MKYSKNMYDALYGRQSIEKKDSISVESQLEYCRYETHGTPYIEYTDRGFSGKNTNRPGFERMMNDIKAGKIKRVIVYKLDRISRSILDFANMMELFQKYDVEFVSSTEKFDTSTPIGRAMLNICIVFAQLERETIQKRVTDAYYARCRHGFYMGGRAPYGFRLTNTVIDNIHTSMYEEVPEECEQLKLIYSMYADPSNSLGEIIRYLNDHDMKHLRGGNWTTSRLSEMLRNPVYVKADIDVYNFYKGQGAKICNPASDFTGSNACYLYKGTVSKSRKQCDLTDKEIVLAPHNGFISSKTWIACRMRCLNNRQSTRTCKPKNSWLLGKVKCGNCGYALTIKKAQTKHGRYFVCSCGGKSGACQGTCCTIYADVLENYILDTIRGKLSEFKNLSCKKGNEETPEICKNKLHLAEIDEEIHDLLSKVGSANSVLITYINDKISELDTKRRNLQEEITSLTCSDTGYWPGSISNPAKIWDDVTFEDRQAIVDIFIQTIKIANGTIEIIWKI